MLIIRQDLIDGYGLQPQIHGTQQDGLRGGTENVPGIASGIAGLKWAFKDRESKNRRLNDLVSTLITEMQKHLPMGHYENYADLPSEGIHSDASSMDSLKSDSKQSGTTQSGTTQSGTTQSRTTQSETTQSGTTQSGDVKQGGSKTGGAKEIMNILKSKGLKKVQEFMNDIEFVILGPEKKSDRLPNTVLMAIVVNKGPRFCNVKFKAALDKKNIVVSIGSACLTSSPKASHVLYALGAPQHVKEGVFRISFSDYNTEKEVKIFVNTFVELLKKEGYLL
jgi:cysteine sulfinate desulfinase/cysteine desulfurase-like protein